MVLLNHTPEIMHEASSLFSNWEFWVSVVGLLGTVLTGYVKQMIVINTMKVNQINMDDKFNARINTLKETMAIDRSSARENHNKLYELCTQMNERLGRMEGKLTSQ